MKMGQNTERIIKTIHVILILLAMFTLTMPWIKVTGISAESRTVWNETIESAEDRIDSDNITAILSTIKDLGLSPVEEAFMNSKFKAVTGFAGLFSNDVKDISLYLNLLKILLLLTIAAGIYSIVYIIRQKPLLKGFDRFIFPVMTAFIGVVQLLMVTRLNNLSGQLQSLLESFAIDDLGIEWTIGFGLSFWIFIGIALSLSYAVGDLALNRSAAGQKVPDKMQRVSQKTEDAIEKNDQMIEDHQDSWDCPYCGARNSSNALFCTHCGAKKPEKSQIQTPTGADSYVRNDYVSTTSVLYITQDESKRGCIKQVEIGDGKAVKIKLPAGLRDGQHVRLNIKNDQNDDYSTKYIKLKIKVR